MASPSVMSRDKAQQSAAMAGGSCPPKARERATVRTSTKAVAKKRE